MWQIFSPIANNKLTADLAAKLKLPVILVVNNTLGCINHTLLSIRGFREFRPNIKFIILNNISKNIPLDNFDELSNYTKTLEDFHLNTMIKQILI